MPDYMPSAHPLILCRRLNVIFDDVREAKESGADQRQTLDTARGKICELFAECGSPSEWSWAVWPSAETFRVLLEMYEIWLGTGDRWPEWPGEPPRKGAA